MPAEFRPQQILRTLADHGVECVVIGGYAAFLQGSPLPTIDIDITPRQRADNLARLSDALRELDAKVRAVELDEPLPFAHNAESLAACRGWNLSTRYGDLDISFEPAGTTGYDDLSRDALTVTLHGVPVRLASLADVVRSKQAANRPKDQRALPVLRELLARQRQQSRRGSA